MSLVRATVFALCFTGVAGVPRAAVADPPAASATPIHDLDGNTVEPSPSVSSASPVMPRLQDEMPMPEARTLPAEHAAAEGAFLPYTIGAATDARFGKVLSGYDGARRAFVYEGAADAPIVGGLALRAGYSSSDLSGHASALLGARYQILSQRRHGIDLGAGLFYLPQGIDGEGLVRSSVFVGTTVGSASLLGSASYGQDPEGDDHHAELSLATLVPAAPHLLLGADARLRALVLTSDAKHFGMTEPILDAAVGPIAHYVLGPLVLTGEVGASSVAMRGPHVSSAPSTEMQYGVLSLFSAGFAL